MKILIACEESQAVCIAMRKLWHEAYSCDILPCSGGHPEWHIQWDVLEHLEDWRDMMIAHPPCTYLSNAWAARLYPKKWELNIERYNKWLEAKDFFMKLYNAPIDKICVENPIPSSVYELPTKSQVIQPYEFWHPYKKKTYLWLKNLSPLVPSNVVEPLLSWVDWWSKKPNGEARKNRWWKFRDSITRSKTFEWIAKAMADQRGGFLDNQCAEWETQKE